MNTPFRLGHFEGAAETILPVIDWLLDDIDAGRTPNPDTVADLRRQAERMRLMVQANTRQQAVQDAARSVA